MVFKQCIIAGRFRKIMDFNISDRMKHIDPRPLKDMFAYGVDPEIISFACGNPDAALFPNRELAVIAAGILEPDEGTVVKGRDVSISYLAQTPDFGTDRSPYEAVMHGRRPGTEEEAQARAMLNGRTFVTPDDVSALAVPVLAHRLVLNRKSSHAGSRAADLVAAVVKKTRVPV